MPALTPGRVSLPRPDDPAILQAMAEATRLGHPIDTAATHALIGPTTARDWRRAGEAELELWDGASELGSYALFAWTLKAAEAEMVDSALRIVHRDTAVPGKGWLPAMTLLERRRPADFGRRDRLDVQQQTLSVTITAELPADAALALLSRLTEQGRGTLSLPEGESTDTDTPLPAPSPTPD